MHCTAHRRAPNPNLGSNLQQRHWVLYVVDLLRIEEPQCPCCILESPVDQILALLYGHGWWCSGGSWRATEDMGRNNSGGAEADASVGILRYAEWSERRGGATAHECVGAGLHGYLGIPAAAIRVNFSAVPNVRLRMLWFHSLLATWFRPHLFCFLSQVAIEFVGTCYENSHWNSLVMLSENGCMPWWIWSEWLRRRQFSMAPLLLLFSWIRVYCTLMSGPSNFWTSSWSETISYFLIPTWMWQLRRIHADSAVGVIIIYSKISQQQSVLLSHRCQVNCYNILWCSEEGVEANMKTLQEWKDQFQAWVHHVPTLFSSMLLVWRSRMLGKVQTLSLPSFSSIEGNETYQARVLFWLNLGFALRRKHHLDLISSANVNI